MPARQNPIRIITAPDGTQRFGCTWVPMETGLPKYEPGKTKVASTERFSQENLRFKYAKPVAGRRADA